LYLNWGYVGGNYRVIHRGGSREGPTGCRRQGQRWQRPCQCPSEIDRWGVWGMNRVYTWVVNGGCVQTHLLNPLVWFTYKTKEFTLYINTTDTLLVHLATYYISGNKTHTR
jgi:hypothetical protein